MKTCPLATWRVRCKHKTFEGTALEMWAYVYIRFAFACVAECDEF